MEATDWTRPEAYADDGRDDLHVVVADAGSRGMHRAFGAAAAALDRASSRSRGATVRADIDIAMDALAVGIATQDQLRRILADDRPVPLAGLLDDVCRTGAPDPRAGRRGPARLDLREDVAATWVAPNTAWAIAAAVVEMLHATGTPRAPIFKAQFLRGHLAIVVGGERSDRRAARRPKIAPMPPEDTPNPFLDRLAGLLAARVVRSGRPGARSLALVIKVRLVRDEPEDRP